MTTLTPEQLLERVKYAIGITGNYQDKALEIYIDEVLAFLASAGVHATVLQSDKVVGIVARGVTDIWNYGAGGGVLSPYFIQRAIQLRNEPVPADKEA